MLDFFNLTNTAKVSWSYNKTVFCFLFFWNSLVNTIQLSSMVAFACIQNACKLCPNVHQMPTECARDAFVLAQNLAIAQTVKSFIIFNTDHELSSPCTSHSPALIWCHSVSCQSFSLCGQYPLVNMAWLEDKIMCFKPINFDKSSKSSDMDSVEWTKLMMP